MYWCRDGTNKEQEIEKLNVADVWPVKENAVYETFSNPYWAPLKSFLGP